MDILNSIWRVISTPNEELIKLFSIPLLMFIEAPLTFSLISNVFNIKFSKKQRNFQVFTEKRKFIRQTLCNFAKNSVP